jgi:tRNA G18 (ribose-2'-O)-methylase SpoU
VLCREGELSQRASDVLKLAEEKGVAILVESEREMRRMSAGEWASELIALEGPPLTTSLNELMSADGPVFLLVGLRYPGNVGFIIRSAEVAGAAGVVLATQWRGGERAEALRIGMRADRFFPVIESQAEEAIRVARAAGRRIVALETTGTRVLWDADLRPPTVIIVGGEATGIDDAILQSVDEAFRIPTRGFIPSYNVQAAVAMVLGEWLRQIGPDANSADFPVASSPNHSKQ